MRIWIITLTIILFSITCVTCTEKEFATCFHHFGCINFTNEWFHPTLRPKNLPPLDRHIVNTKFLLLTAAAESNTICYDQITANAANIKTTLYDSHYGLMVLIHDFTSNGYTGWIKHMTIQLTQLERYNIVALDWQEGAEPPYLQAISNARIVALELELLLTTLQEEFDLMLSDVHLVGHGLGAHIAGYVGKALSGEIGRITGLDPNGLFFEGMPPPVRLNYDDALYVEVLHTDGEGSYHQGTMQPLGNMDFYFNNGSAQPGCRNLNKTMNLMDVQRDSLKEGAVLPDCSHKRAFHYYIAAMHDKSCSFLALPLGTAMWHPVECVESNSDVVLCATVGLDVDTKYYSNQIYSKFEVDTASCQPYCRNRYQMQVDFAQCPEADKEILGFFNIIVTDDEGLEANLTFNNGSDAQVIFQGERLTFTAWGSGAPVDEVQHMHVTWHFTTPFCFMCRNDTCVTRMVLTHVRSHISATNTATSSYFCPCGDNPYTVLYDHRPSDQLVRCQRKRT